MTATRGAGPVLALVALVVSGCGATDATPAIGHNRSPLETANGLSPNGLMRNGLMRNGLMRNGLMRNGLMRNGLAENGLMRNGLSTPDFQAWFEDDPTTGAMVMEYVVRCAAAANQSFSYTSPGSGTTYVWTGSLGLAPGWTSGAQASLAEEQVISACLAAHVNKYGVHMPVSVRGVGATGVAIPYADGELATYSVAEAAFFGNLFEDEGVFLCIDHKPWNKAYSSARACAFESKASGVSDCSPIVVAGDCSDVCGDKKTRSASGYYASCTWNGVTYLPLTTALSPDEIYRCGDGVCQVSEHCGTGKSADSCQSDCGLCP